MIMKKPIIIPKEEISSVIFGKYDVLASIEDRHTRKWQADRAVSLGNLFQQKVKIVFENKAGDLQQIETTIWSVTEDYILIKGGRYLPLKSIQEIS